MSYVICESSIEKQDARETFQNFFAAGNVSMLAWVWNSSPSEKVTAWVHRITTKGYEVDIVPDIRSTLGTSKHEFFLNACPIEEDELKELQAAKEKKHSAGDGRANLALGLALLALIVAIF